MVVVTLLVATGWSIMRPFLNIKEKKVLLIAVALQLLANTAIIITDEWAPGSIAYLEWSDVFRIADFIASIAIIVPIRWSIISLQQTTTSSALSEEDGAKTKETIDRLEALRKFYLMTMAYVYLTRLILWILSQGLSFDTTWISPAAEEVATLAYYVATGWYFRPSVENAYLRVSSQDDDGDGDGGSGGGNARATGAAPGAVEGAAPTVQTVEVARRPQTTATTGATAISIGNASADIGDGVSGSGSGGGAEEWEEKPAQQQKKKASSSLGATKASRTTNNPNNRKVEIHEDDEFDFDDNLADDDDDDVEVGSRGGGGGVTGVEGAGAGQKQQTTKAATNAKRTTAADDDDDEDFGLDDDEDDSDTKRLVTHSSTVAGGGAGSGNGGSGSSGGGLKQVKKRDS
jgi:hypothetical protein